MYYVLITMILTLKSKVLDSIALLTWKNKLVSISVRKDSLGQYLTYILDHEYNYVRRNAVEMKSSTLVADCKNNWIFKFVRAQPLPKLIVNFKLFRFSECWQTLYSSWHLFISEEFLNLKKIATLYDFIVRINNFIFPIQS